MGTRDLKSVGQPAPDNRLTDLEGLHEGLVTRVFHVGLRRLLRGRPAARSRLSRYQPVIRAWLFWLVVPLGVGVLWCWLVPWGWLGWAGLGVGAGVSGLALVVAAAVDATVPPPTRPFCQSNALGAFFPHYAASGLVEVVADQLWVAQVPLVFHGVQLGARMALVRVGPEDLLVYSPLSLAEEDLARVRSLGRLRWIVAPSVVHHLFVTEWVQAFPSAELWVGPGLAERRPDLTPTGTLANDRDLPWNDELVRCEVLEGHDFHREAVLFHEASRSLLVTDALMNMGHSPETGPVIRGLAALFGMAGRPTPPTDVKWTLSDPGALARSAARVAAWPFDRIVLAHGRLVDVQARKVWRDAFAFVLRDDEERD